MPDCKNCGGRHTVTRCRGPRHRKTPNTIALTANVWRYWCSYCGYWADARKPNE